MFVEDCDILVRYEVIVKGRLVSRDVYGEGVLVLLIKYVIMVVYVLILVKSNEIDVLVCVFNLSDKDVKVKKNIYLVLF